MRNRQHQKLISSSQGMAAAARRSNLSSSIRYILWPHHSKKNVFSGRNHCRIDQNGILLRLDGNFWSHNIYLELPFCVALCRCRLAAALSHRRVTATNGHGYAVTCTKVLLAIIFIHRSTIECNKSWSFFLSSTTKKSVTNQ